MMNDPSIKYRPFPPVRLTNRAWPDQAITRAPIWMSTDLRDGNQALFEPMDTGRKLRMFSMLCAMGFKEIEVAFPSASQTDFDFVRALVEGGRIPSDVTVEVLTQAREHLIRRTFDSLAGARRAIIHVYNAVSPRFREVVFGMSRSQVLDMAVDAVRLVRECARERPETEWVLEYSPETFSTAELDFSKEICDAVTETWEAAPDRKVILNLPATVETATPNVYADQIEWMHKNLARRDGIVLSVHPHNDRGSAVAAAELALMAGAERVEGCLFGNGERTGNVDIVTLALNLFTQGVSPGLDFSDLGTVARTVERFNQLPIHPRHPYAGDLVFTAFSGSHQDAIKKGLAAQTPDAPWQVPYLPLDPADVGRTYDSIIRVNSQSGKGGIAYLLETVHGLVMPRRLQVEFSREVQRFADETGHEITAQALWDIFTKTYLDARAPLRYLRHRQFDVGLDHAIRLDLTVNGTPITLTGKGNGPIAATLDALRLPAHVHSYEERAMGQGADSKAAAFVEIALDSAPGSLFGVGIHQNIVTASVQAVLGGLNRALAQASPRERQALLGALTAPRQDALAARGR